MTHSKSSSRTALYVLVGLSLVFGLGVITFRAGLGTTSYEAVDSEGRTMGFND